MPISPTLLWEKSNHRKNVLKGCQFERVLFVSFEFFFARNKVYVTTSKQCLVFEARDANGNNVADSV